jgi:lipopolysaccharide export system protein LptA
MSPLPVPVFHASDSLALAPPADRSSWRWSAGPLRHSSAAALLAVLAGAGWATWPLEAGAERADRAKPLKYEADGGRADDKQGLVELRGNVVVSKGTLEIRADRIELRNGKQGQYATATGTSAAPATFRQKREGVDEYMEGHAQRIEYDVRNETVRFSQQALLRRVRRGTVSDEISGQSITYDNVAESFEVLGGGGAVPASTPSPGRVRGVLAPRDEPADKSGSVGDKR